MPQAAAKRLALYTGARRSIIPPPEWKQSGLEADEQRLYDPAESEEFPLMKKGKNDAFFGENLLTVNNVVGSREGPVD